MNDDELEGYLALRRTSGWFFDARTVLSVEGGDARSYLQSQLSQDIAALAEGATVLSLILSPQGKLIAALQVHCRQENSFYLVTDQANAEAVQEALLRFKLRAKVTVERLDWRCLAVRGAWSALASLPAQLGGSAGTALWTESYWPGTSGWDLFGPDPQPPLGGVLSPAAAVNALRIEAGVPRPGDSLGGELDDRTIPAEADLVEGYVSFTKGCYVGQELVARIDSRGNKVPRRLRGLVAISDTEVPVPPGAGLWNNDQEVGRLTSSGWSPSLGRQVALAYVKRGVEPGDPAEIRWEGDRMAAEVRELPLVGGEAPGC
jgi:tRNA-modifying protein YgfZ